MERAEVARAEAEGRDTASAKAEADANQIDQLNAFELLNHRYLVIDRAGFELPI